MDSLAKRSENPLEVRYLRQPQVSPVPPHFPRPPRRVYLRPLPWQLFEPWLAQEAWNKPVLEDPILNVHMDIVQCVQGLRAREERDRLRVRPYGQGVRSEHKESP